MRQLNRVPKGIGHSRMPMAKFRCPITGDLTYWSLAVRRTVSIKDKHKQVVRQVSVALSYKGAAALDEAQGPERARLVAWALEGH